MQSDHHVVDVAKATAAMTSFSCKTHRKSSKDIAVYPAWDSLRVTSSNHSFRASHNP